MKKNYTFIFPTGPNDKGSAIKSANLLAERIASDLYIILEKDAEMLTPSCLHLKSNSVVVVKELQDGVLEYVNNSDDEKADLPQVSVLGNLFIRFLIVIAVILLVASAIVHFSTYLTFDPFLSSMSNVWLLHVLVFVVFIPAVFLTNRWCKDSPGNSGQDFVFRHAPKWIRIMCGTFFAYAILNFIICMVILGSGGPSVRDGKYILSQKGKFIKELTKSEWERLEAVETRAFSGHWMLFYSGSVMALAGVLEIHRRKMSGEELIIKDDDELTPQEKNPPHSTHQQLDLKEETKRCNKILASMPSEEDALPRPNRIAGFLSLLGYVLCIGIIISKQPALNLIICPVLACIGVKLIKRMVRRSKEGDDSFEALPGCLTIIPNFFLAGIMAHKIATIIYMIIFAGFFQTLTGAVEFIQPKEGPNMLSNGQAVDLTIWGAMPILVMFPLVILMTSGLTGLMNICGRNLRKVS